MTKELIEFIKKSPTSFHAVANVADMLEKAGATRLYEHLPWNIECGKSYYVLRGGSAVISFSIPKMEKEILNNFQIISSHSDSPSFKIKENPELVKGEHYVELNVERYGGALLRPWFDRPLSIAGRVMVSDGDELKSKLIDFDKDVCMIPSLAIHMDREANDGGKIDVQKTMMPIWGDGNSKGTFMKKLAELAATDESKIAAYDLFLYNRVEPSIWGAEQEYFSCSRIDDLMCAYASAVAFVNVINECSQNRDGINLLAIFDNEEVGSSSKAGADSDFLENVLERIKGGLAIDDEQYRMMLASSFMVSADNGHAFHPNYPEKCDPTNQPFMNGGVVIKYNAAQKYTTDGMSGALFKKICERAGVPVQSYVNNSNVAGGSTLGNIANTHVTMNTVDIGAAQLSMHSPYETAGTADTLYLEKAMEMFYRSNIKVTEEGIKI